MEKTAMDISKVQLIIDDKPEEHLISEEKARELMGKLDPSNTQEMLLGIEPCYLTTFGLLKVVKELCDACGDVPIMKYDNAEKTYTHFFLNTLYLVNKYFWIGFNGSHLELHVENEKALVIND